MIVVVVMVAVTVTVIVRVSRAVGVQMHVSVFLIDVPSAAHRGRGGVALGFHPLEPVCNLPKHR